jgi:hypothetical protein
MKIKIDEKLYHATSTPVTVYLEPNSTVKGAVITIQQGDSTYFVMVKKNSVYMNKK